MRSLLAPCFVALLAAGGGGGPALQGQVTETPRTVAPGRFLMEMDGLRLALDRADAAGNVYSATAVASTLVTTGLTRSLDVQVGFELFLRRSLQLAGTGATRSGIGDVFLRTKWRFWEDAQWGAAAAVIPYVRLPTNSGGVGSNAVEGGLIVPWEMGVPGGFMAGAMLRWDLVRDAADVGYDSSWLLAGFVQRSLIAGISVYGEATLELASTGFSDTAGTMGVGVLWQFNKVLQFDYELLRGVNRRAAAWTHVARVNWSFW